MRLHSLYFLNKDSNLEIERIHFDDLTLLVGASGVGKTQILNAIHYLKNLATKGSVSKAIEWSCELSVNEDATYLWTGVTEKEKRDSIGSGRVSFMREVLIKNQGLPSEKKIFERSKGQVFFLDSHLPNSDSSKSLISIYKDDDIIHPIYKAIEGIIFFDFESERAIDVVTTPDSNLDKVSKTESGKNALLNIVREGTMPNKAKLIYAYKYFPDIFKEVKWEFQGIFEKVEDLRIKTFLVDEKREGHAIQLKEEGVGKWIDSGEFSAGMFKTLLFITATRLSSPGSLILLDEFENSLGINCVDSVAGEMLSDKKQFIITSHHPYIINRIPMDSWKIITRNGLKIKSRTAKEYRIGESKHDAFMQLINLESYRTGSDE